MMLYLIHIFILLVFYMHMQIYLHLKVYGVVLHSLISTKFAGLLRTCLLCCVLQYHAFIRAFKKIYTLVFAVLA